MIMRPAEFEPKYQGEFRSILQLILSKSMRVIETKESDERAITVRVQPDIANRLDAYAKSARISRSFLIRMLLEGALNEMDDLVLFENERQKEHEELMSISVQEMEEAQREKENRIASILKTWKED